MNDLIEARPTAVFEGLVTQALERNLPIESIERFVALLERQQEKRAKEAFIGAFAKAKEEMPPIYKDRLVVQKPKLDAKGQVEKERPTYRHATLANITQIANPVLGKHGLTVSWRAEQSVREGANGEVTQIVTVKVVMQHQDGHAETFSMSAPPDTSGNKTGVQAIGSAVSYLERYTYCAIVGLAAQDPAEEDDGTGGEKDEDQLPVEVKAIVEGLRVSARLGTRQYAAAWAALTKEERKQVGQAMHEKLKAEAAEAEQENGGE